MDTAIMLALNLFGVFMEMVTLWYFCRFFFGKSRRSVPFTLLIYGLTGVLALGVSIFGKTGEQHMLGYYFVTLLPMMLYDGHIMLKTFLVLVFLVIEGGAETLTKALLVAVNGDLISFAIKNTWGKYAQGLLISKFLAFAIVRMLSLMNRVKKPSLSILSILAFLILPITTTLAINQLMKISYIIDQQDSYLWTFFIVAMLIASNVILFYTFEKQAEGEQTKLRLFLLEKQQQEQQKYYSELSNEKMKTNQIAHDFNKSLLAISGYLKDNRIEEALNYLKRLDVNLQNTIYHYTGDMAIDTVLTEKTKEAQKLNSKLQILSFIQAPLYADGVSIAILIANILDNALEATVDIEQAEITLKITINDSFIDIIARNPIIKKVKIVNNYIATTKTDKERHGLGIISIRNTIDWYDGDLSLSEQDGYFILDAMLMNVKK